MVVMETGSVASPDIFLDKFENGLRAKIANSDAPFLGLFADAFKSNKALVRRKLSQPDLPNDRLTSYCRYLDRWPALFGSYLAATLLEKYGTEGTPAVYRHLDEALGTDLEGNDDRRRLYHAFRRACLTLNIGIGERKSGSYMVREYLRQAGVPQHFVLRMAEAMFRFAEKHHAPLADDDDGVANWQAHLCEMGQTGFSKGVSAALARDEDGYYARLFLRHYWEEEPSHSGDGGEPSPSSLEFEMKRAIDKARAQQKRRPIRGRLLLPEIRFWDDTYGIYLPSDDKGHTWYLRLDDGPEIAVNPEEEGQFIALDEERFKVVSARLPDHDICWRKTVWEDHGNHRFLLFRETGGTLARAGRLMPRDSLEPIYTEPGEYVAVMKFEPEESMETDELGDAFVDYFRLEPGGAFSLTRGSNMARIAVEVRPCLAFKGACYKGLKGKTFYRSTDLSLHVTLPEEVRNLHGWRLRIKASHSDESPLELDLGIPPHTCSCIPLEPHLACFPKGMALISIELCQQNGNRIHARNSALVWIGLEQVEQRVVFHGAAENLVEDACENVTVNEEKITFRDRIQNTFRLVFEIRANHRVSLLFRIPGLFLSLHEGGWEQSAQMRFLSPGATIPVDYEQRPKLEIHYNDTAVLKFGKTELKPDFPGKGIARISLASLCDEMESGCDELNLIPEDGIPITLATLTTPHGVNQFGYRREAGDLIVEMNLPKRAPRVRVSGMELLNGQAFATPNLFVNDYALNPERPYRIDFTDCDSHQPDGYKHQLFFKGSSFPPGIYLFRPDFLIDGRWGELRNARRDRYLIGFVRNRDGSLSPQNAITLMENSRTTNLDDSITRFKRIHKALLSCYALECWSRIKWLKTLWYRLLEEFRASRYSDEQFRVLLRTCLSKPEDTATDSWFPMLNPAMELPMLFCRKARHYATLPEKEDTPRFDGVLHCLRDLGRYQAMRGNDLLEARDISLQFWTGFQNIHQVSQGLETPRTFRPQRFRDALEQMPENDRWRWLQRERWQPGRGHYLDALHLRYAQSHFETHYYRSLNGYHRLRSGLLYTAKQVLIHSPDSLFGALPEHLAREHWMEDIRSFSDLDRDESGEDHCKEALGWCRRLLALYAKICRLEPRGPGVMAAFMDKLIKSSGKSETDVRAELGHLLYLGYDLFAFYLMLWELVFRFELDGE